MNCRRCAAEEHTGDRRPANPAIPSAPQERHFLAWGVSPRLAVAAERRPANPAIPPAPKERHFLAWRRQPQVGFSSAGAAFPSLGRQPQVGRRCGTSAGESRHPSSSEGAAFSSLAASAPGWQSPRKGGRRIPPSVQLRPAPAGRGGNGTRLSHESDRAASKGPPRDWFPW